MRRGALVTVALLGGALLFAAEDSTEAKLMHNEGWFIEQAYRKSHAECERTVQEMKDLHAVHRKNEFATAAKLVGEIDRRMTRYNGVIQKLVVYYKQKWNQKHYQGMEQKWKEETFAKHKAKLKAVQTLMLDLQQAFNAWTAARNDAAKKKNDDLIAAYRLMNNALEEALAAGLTAEEAVFKDLETELSAIKNLK